MPLEVTSLFVSVGLDDAPLMRGLAEVPRVAQAQIEAGMRTATEAVTQATARQTSAVAEAAARQTGIRLASLREEEAALAHLPEAERSARQALIAEARRAAQQTLEACEKAFASETAALETQLGKQTRARDQAAARAQADARETAQTATRRAVGGGALGGISASLAGQNLTANVTRPLIGGLEEALKTTADFDTALAVFQATSRATADQMERVRQKAIALGNDLTLPATSANDAAEAMAKLNQMGFSVQQSMDAAKGTLQLSAAAHISNSNAARYEVDTLHEFGLAANQATRVADVLTNAHLRSGRSVEDVGNAFKMAGPAFKAAHVPLEEAAAAVSELGLAGIFGTQAGTNLRAMLMRLEAPPRAAANALKELNVSIYDSTGHIKDYRDIIDQLHRAMEGMNDRTKLPILNDIFGKQASAGALVLVDQGAAAFDKMRDAMARQGSAADLAKAQMTGLNGAVEGFKSAVETAELKAQPFADALARLLNDDITPLVNKFGDLDTTTQEWILGAAAALAGAGPLLMGIGAVTSAVNLMKGAFVATEGAEAATAARGATAFAAAGPYVLALAATAAAVYKIKTAWDDANRAQELHGRTDALGPKGTPDQARPGDAKALRDEAADLQRQFELRQNLQRGIVNVPLLGSKQLLPDAAGNALTDQNTALGAAYHASQDEIMNRIQFDLGRAKQIEDAAKNAGKALGAAVKKDYDQGVADGLTQTAGQSADALLGAAAGGGASEAQGQAIEARIKAQQAAEKAQEAHHKKIEAEQKRFSDAMAAARAKLREVQGGGTSDAGRIAAQFGDISAARRKQLADIDAEIAHLQKSRQEHQKYADALEAVYAKIRDARSGPKSQTEQLKEKFPGASPAEIAGMAAAEGELRRLEKAQKDHAAAVARTRQEEKSLGDQMTKAKADLAGAGVAERAYSVDLTAGKIAADTFHKALDGLSATHQRQVRDLAAVEVQTRAVTEATKLQTDIQKKVGEATAKTREEALAYQQYGQAISTLPPVLQQAIASEAAYEKAAEATQRRNGDLTLSFLDAAQGVATFTQQHAIEENQLAMTDALEKNNERMRAMAELYRVGLPLVSQAITLDEERSYALDHLGLSLDHVDAGTRSLIDATILQDRETQALTASVEGLAGAYAGAGSEIDDFYAKQRAQINLGQPGATYNVPAGGAPRGEIGPGGLDIGGGYARTQGALDLAKFYGSQQLYSPLFGPLGSSGFNNPYPGKLPGYPDYVAPPAGGAVSTGPTPGQAVSTSLSPGQAVSTSLSPGQAVANNQTVNFTFANYGNLTGVGDLNAAASQMGDQAARSLSSM